MVARLLEINPKLHITLLFSALQIYMVHDEFSRIDATIGTGWKDRLVPLPYGEPDGNRTTGSMDWGYGQRLKPVIKEAFEETLIALIEVSFSDASLMDSW